MTRLNFGAQVTGAGGPFGVAFAPTHRGDQVEAALRGYFSPDDLGRLSDQVRKAAHRRGRKGKDAGLLLLLGSRLIAASRPSTTPVAMRWYANPTGGTPLLVELLDGDQAGRTVLTVPPGVKWRFAGLDGVGDRVYCQPVDDQGNDLGERVWSIGAGGTPLGGAAVYLVPFDAIRTGDGADAH